MGCEVYTIERGVICGTRDLMSGIMLLSKVNNYRCKEIIETISLGDWVRNWVSQAVSKGTNARFAWKFLDGIFVKIAYFVSMHNINFNVSIMFVNS